MTLLEILRAFFEILVLWALFYQLYRAVKDSRAAAILAGLIATVILGYIILELAHAVVLKQLAGLIIGPGTILVILFLVSKKTGSVHDLTFVWQGRWCVYFQLVRTFVRSASSAA